jgi:hypothetical protein
MVQRAREGEWGGALVMALLLLVLAGVIGGALALSLASEQLIAAHHHTTAELRLAADAGLARAQAEIATMASWNDVLQGRTLSSCRDTTLQPRQADGRVLDLAGLTVALQRTTDALAPWGADNPRWRLFAYGPLDLMTGAAPDGRVTPYVVVWLADDQADGDGDALTDANDAVWLRAEAFGLGSARAALEATIRRPAPYPSALRVVSWRFAAF